MGRAEQAFTVDFLPADMAVGLGPLLAEASASAEERRLLLGAGLTNLGEVDKSNSSRQQAAGRAVGEEEQGGQVKHGQCGRTSGQ